jgi:hypothetical protein
MTVDARFVETAVSLPFLPFRSTFYDISFWMSCA